MSIQDEYVAKIAQIMQHLQTAAGLTDSRFLPF